MALLSDAAIELLDRLSETWTDQDALRLRGTEPALLELRREGLVETDIYPPPDPGRRYYRDAGKRRDDAIKRVSRVRRTGRGSLRLDRIRHGSVRREMAWE